MLTIQVTAHPLALDALGRLRGSSTTGEEFRRQLQRFTEVVTVEATSLLRVDTHTEPSATGHPATIVRMSESISVIPVLRAGLGMLDGVLRTLPGAAIGFVGLSRDHDTLEPRSYYTNLPEDVGGTCILLEPMIATGGSLIEAVARVEETIRPERILTLSLLAAPEGIDALRTADHPDRNLTIITGSIDDRLDENGYIVPGLGDAGDRICGGN